MNIGGITVKRTALATLAGSAAMLAACSQQDNIDPEGQVFDEIEEEAVITLLGNEPFWSFEIVREGEGYLATYTTPENLEGTSFAAARFAGNNGLGFSGELDGTPVQIALTPGECDDGMSDRTYPYTATIAMGDKTLYGCGYSGDEPFEAGDGA